MRKLLHIAPGSPLVVGVYMFVWCTSFYRVLKSCTCPLLSPQVTVRARENETVSETCIWDVEFQTNTGEEEDGGELPLLTAAFYNVTNSSFSDFSTSGAQV